MHQKYVNKFHGWNKWKKIICQIPTWFLLFSEDRKSFLVIKWVFFLFCNKRTQNHEQEIWEERCTFPCFNYSVVFSSPVPIIDFVTWLYKLSWKMIIYKNLLSIFLESNFWKRNISLMHTFFFHRPFVIYFHWTSFLVFTCNIPATLLTVFVWKSFHNHLQKSIHVYMCYRTNVWYRLTHHLLGHENSSKYLRMYYLKYHCRN